jgi:hypothetical protein
MKTVEDIELTIPLDSVCFVAIKSREFEVKDITSVPDEASNASDDRMVEVLEMRSNDPVFEELKSFIDAMSEDEQIDLVALAWIGRGDGDITEWDDIREEAARAHNKRTAEYLLGIPLLSDYLEDALSALDHSCEEVEEDRL